MASSRRVGTNESIATYGTGKTYTSLATWEADTDVDLVSAAQSQVLEIYGNSYDDKINFTGATTNANYFRIIRPAGGNLLNTGAITTKHFITTSGNSFYIYESYTQVQDLVVKIEANASSNYNAFVAGGGFTYLGFIGCVAIDCNNAGSGSADGFWLWPTTSSANKAFAINCIAHNCKGYGFIGGETQGSYSIIYNCTSVNNGIDGFEAGGDYTHCILTNCGAFGNVRYQFYPDSFLETTCSETSPTFVSGTDNFHLASIDTVWKNQGTDLSADANYPFDDDIDKEKRNTWDIGADESIQPTVTLGTTPTVTTGTTPTTTLGG
jgi:hypothetical protein